MKELTSAAIVTIGYDASENGRLVEHQVKCVVPASWLWSQRALPTRSGGCCRPSAAAEGWRRR